MKDLTQDLVNSLYRYEDGRLYHKRFNGREITNISSTGYRRVGLDGQNYMVHRIIFLMHHGYLPNEIDHIDRNPLNNKVENLREVSRSQNRLNSKVRHGSTSGIKGVHWHKASSQWAATINIKGKSKHLGLFLDKHEAGKTVYNARIKQHGEYA